MGSTLWNWIYNFLSNRFFLFIFIVKKQEKFVKIRKRVGGWFFWLGMLLNDPRDFLRCFAARKMHGVAAKCAHVRTARHAVGTAWHMDAQAMGNKRWFLLKTSTFDEIFCRGA